MIKKTVKIPIYRHLKVVFVITEDIKGFYNSVVKKDDGLDCEGLFFEHYNFLYICVKPNVSAGTIAHECFHATAYVMDNIGCDLKEESEEPYAYLLGWFVDEFEKIRRYI